MAAAGSRDAPQTDVRRLDKRGSDASSPSGVGRRSNGPVRGNLEDNRAAETAVGLHLVKRPKFGESLYLKGVHLGIPFGDDGGLRPDKQE